MLKKETGTSRKSFSYSCTPDMFNRISSICDTKGCTKSWLVTKALESYFAELEEDARDYETAVAAWEEFESSGEKGISAEQLYKELGL